MIVWLVKFGVDCCLFGGGGVGVGVSHVLFFCSHHMIKISHPSQILSNQSMYINIITGSTSQTSKS